MPKMTTREKSKASLKEDVKCLLEELHDAEEEKNHKTFTRDSVKVMQKVLHYSKKELQ